jgi:adenylate cyclase
VIGQSGAVSSSSGAPGKGTTEHAERTFVFIDLSGFTALTAAHGDESAADLIDRFEDIVRSTLPEDGEFVKSIGDEVMLAFREPEAALDAARAIYAYCLDTPGFPIPRGGAFHGSAVVRSDDYLGGSVNTAARIAAEARSGQFLVDNQVANVAGTRGFSVIHLGEFVLRHLVDPVSIYEVNLVMSDEYVIDPVCRMRVEQDAAIGVRYNGKDYWLCSLACAEQFTQHPEKYPSPA